MCRSISIVTWWERRLKRKEIEEIGDGQNKPVISFEGQSEKFRFNVIE